MIERYRAVAIRAAEDAFARNNDPKVLEVKTVLQNANIIQSATSPCGRGGIGCAEMPNSMWFTDLFFDREADEQLHIVLHEASHLIDMNHYTNECLTDRMTRKILKDAGLPTPRSVYDLTCGRWF
jgi:hypothetical protein